MVDRKKFRESSILTVLKSMPKQYIIARIVKRENSIIVMISFIWKSTVINP